MPELSSVKIYTTQTCGYCFAARNLLNNKGVGFEDIDVSADVEIRQQMMSLSGRHTVPQIFINEQPIGGYDDLMALDAAGELDLLLGIT
jgi:glutaredoxin 3